jgi:hypothetical protein
MARIEGRSTLSVEAVLILNEDECAALDALFGYGIEPFLEVFYQKMGRAYLEPHEKGLRSLHEKRTGLSKVLQRAQAARKAFYGDPDVRE